MEEADEAIQEVMLGKTPLLNMQADNSFAQRILDYIRDELNYIKLDKKGNEIGIVKKTKEQSDNLMAYLQAHETIIIQNTQRKSRALAGEQMMREMGVAPSPEQSIDIPQPTQQEQQAQTAQPFEKPTSTSAGVASASQNITNRLS